VPRILQRTCGQNEEGTACLVNFLFADLIFLGTWLSLRWKAVQRKITFG